MKQLTNDAIVEWISPFWTEEAVREYDERMENHAGRLELVLPFMWIGSCGNEGPLREAIDVMT